MSKAQLSLASFQRWPLAVILGTNEIASAVAIPLTRAGYSVVMSHDPFPPVIRRAMSFHDALFDDPAEVDGVVGERAESLLEIAAVVAKRETVAVTMLALTDLLALRRADVLVDARMQKQRITPDFRFLAGITVGLGPKFLVGVNCDIAVETRPIHNGALIENGATEEADGLSRCLGGVGAERFVYSQQCGIWRTPVDIGMWIPKGFVVGRHDGVCIHAPRDGFVRGVIRDATLAPEGVKLLEMDPRGRAASWRGTDERGRVIADATFEAITRHGSRAPLAPALVKPVAGAKA
jgi:xanthine dehydrogenase accessory factor